MAKVEKLLQWALGNFVFENDDPAKSCDTQSNGQGSSISYWTASPDVGNCKLDFSNIPTPEDPIYSAPLTQYSHGKTGVDELKFNISLSTKICQLRCLEGLQVQQSKCYSNLLSDGGFCDLELAPTRSVP